MFARSLAVLAAKIAIGPLFVHIAGAIVCLFFSSIFHLFNVYSEKAQALLSRLDYAGVGVLVTGSSFPPVLYGFACNPYIKWTYISVISTTNLVVLVITVLPGADGPRFRKLRGTLFIVIGLLAGISPIHAVASRYVAAMKVVTRISSCPSLTGPSGVSCMSSEDSSTWPAYPNVGRPAASTLVYGV